MDVPGATAFCIQISTRQRVILQEVEAIPQLTLFPR